MQSLVLLLSSLRLQSPPLLVVLFLVVWQQPRVVGLVVASQNALSCEDGANTTTTTTTTPSDQLGPFYVPDSPQTSRMGPIPSLDDPSLRLEVYGRVLSTLSTTATTTTTSSNEENCPSLPLLGLENITLEVWFAGPPDEDGNYYQPSDYRGQVVTNERGEYNFTQVFPSLYPTRPVLHDHWRLSDPMGTELLVTQMYFATDVVQGWTTDNGYVEKTDTNDAQTVPMVIQNDGTRRVEFNIYVAAAVASTTTLPISTTAPTTIGNPAPTPTPTTSTTPTPTLTTGTNPAPPPTPTLLTTDTNPVTTLITGPTTPTIGTIRTNGTDSPSLYRSDGCGTLMIRLATVVLLQWWWWW